MKTEIQSEVTVPVLQFSHHGRSRTLVKHPEHISSFKRGEITLAELKFKPWYLRREIDGKDRKFPLSPVDKDAIRAAKDLLNGQRDRPAEFNRWLDERDARRGLTLGELAIKWKAAGFPDHNGRVRDPKAAARINHDLDIALRWWATGRVATAAERFAEFITWRRANTKAERGTGDRAADLDLNALSCCCQWGVFAGLVEVNPFRGRKYGGKRPTYHDKDKVEHCSDAMPESDEVVHRILTWFFSGDHQHCIAGAWLAWNNLTGLRTGEPFYLLRHPAITEEPHRPDLQPPGSVFPFGEQRVMKVQREKNGQNPFVVLHPAATAFLQTWSAWLDNVLSASCRQSPSPWFPSPEDPSQPFCPLYIKKGSSEPATTRLNDLLAQACTALNLPRMTPSGFGRAYYTRVRKSQRVSNAVIAEELGQTTLGKLIRTTYGRGDDMFGSRRYDWLPEDKDRHPCEPAWKLLEVSTAPANVVRL